MNPAALTNLVSTTAEDSGMDGLNHATLAAGVHIESVSIDENGRTGSETTYVYSGTYSYLKTQQTWCRSWGAYNMTLKRPEGGSIWRLTAVFPFNEYSTDIALAGTYELDVEIQQGDLCGGPVLGGTYDSAGNQLTAPGLPTNYCFMVAKIYDYYQHGGFSTTSNTTGTPTDFGYSEAIQYIKQGVPTTSNYQARALQLFASMILAGGDAGYIEYYHVFKRTITAALPIQVTASNVGKGMIWTTAEIVSWENVSTSGFFEMDTTSLWLKSPPVILACARQKTQVSYNYTEFKRANGLAYKAYGSAVLMYASPTDLPPGC
jgi:hypothetical protein